MGDGQTSSLFAALKLDEYPLLNQCMLVEELNNADGSFILSSVIKDQIEKSNSVILILCHNSFGHFHSISQKLSYNLSSLKESGKVIVVDLLEKIIKENFLNEKKPLRQLYSIIKNHIDKLEITTGVSIILENVGNLLLVDTKEMYAFIGYLRGLIFERKNSSLVCSIHNFPDSLNFDKLITAIKHFADVFVTLKDLETGRANDVTGHLIVSRKDENYIRCKSEYQYQLLDKNIQVFTPGTRNFL